jgi:hypothetical protein
MSIIDAVKSSHLICGDDTHAFRDPTVIHRDGVFHLYCTYVVTEAPEDIYMYTIHTASTDLVHWTEPEKLTPRNKALNYSSPGNVVEFGGKYLMCLQTYPRENGEKYGNQNARVFTMASEDLVHWDEPRLIPVKGDTPVSEMGRMIDPYLVFDPKTGLWNCFFKQNGVSRSVSADMEHWDFLGRMDGGENVSVISKDGGYYLFHSPENGIGVKYSADLEHWQDVGELLTFGQADWEWAKGRLTAGFVLPFEEEGETLYLMFFHGTGPQDESVTFDVNAGIGLAWSRDLIHWEWR